MKKIWTSYIENLFLNSSYVCEVFTAEEKAAWRDEHFPEDCREAVAIGEKLILNAQ